jgi:hypothetical protein
MSESDEELDDNINEPLYREIVKPFLQMLLVFFAATNAETVQIRDASQYFSKAHPPDKVAKVGLLLSLLETSGNGILARKTV